MWRRRLARARPAGGAPLGGCSAGLDSPFAPGCRPYHDSVSACPGRLVKQLATPPPWTMPGCRPRVRVSRCSASEERAPPYRRPTASTDTTFVGASRPRTASTAGSPTTDSGCDGIITWLEHDVELDVIASARALGRDLRHGTRRGGLDVMGARRECARAPTRSRRRATSSARLCAGGPRPQTY
jgi:hypothetical protein